MRVSEIFKSCQGEGVHVGLPTVFVRLSGCNLYPNGCSFCDTKYAQGSNGREMSPASVVKRVEELSNGCRRVVLTGGEPLYQPEAFVDLVDRLQFRDYYIEVFTNGTIILPEPVHVDSWVADIKCPSSGAADKCLVEEWLSVLRAQDCAKFVVSNAEDLDYVLRTLRTYPSRAQVLVSPMVPNCPNYLFGDVLMSRREWLQAVWEFCVEHDYRFSFQVHKLIYGNRRGV